MDRADISQLASILREDGDKVLGGLCKLSLSTNQVENLCKCFSAISEQVDMMSSSFSTLHNNSTPLEYFRDVQFLHDFVQNSISLKITQPSILLQEEVINLSRFRNLRLLELNKVRCNTVKGIQLLRMQLHILICNKSIDSIREALEKCGGDSTPGFLWNELKEAAFSHNGIRELDSSFEYVPWLHTLDLSHNEIQDISPLNCLHNLKYLNLGYNKLVGVSKFTGQICSRLQVIFKILYIL